MRIYKAVAAPQKPTSFEAQRDNGRQRSALLAAMTLNVSVVAILVIFGGVAYFADLPTVCGNAHTWGIGEDSSRPILSLERRIVPHSSWSARPRQQTQPLVHPVPYVVVKHTAGPPCSGLPDCTPVLRAIQELHWQKYDQPEISYNFLIDTDGNIYEGRGWNNTNTSKGIGLHCNVDVTLIGNYVEQNVTRETSSALRWLLYEGVSTGMLAPDYRLLAHNQVKNTLSPGRGVLMEIADWPHRCLQHCDRGAICIRPADSDVSTSR